MNFLAWFFRYSQFKCIVVSFLVSQSERENAGETLNKNLNQVESGLSEAEHRKPDYDENDSVNLEAVMAQMEKQKVGIVKINYFSNLVSSFYV